MTEAVRENGDKFHVDYFIVKQTGLNRCWHVVRSLEMTMCREVTVACGVDDDTSSRNWQGW